MFDIDSWIKRSFSRREMLKTVAASAALCLASQACRRHVYVRGPEELDLGPVKELLYERVHVRNKAVLLFRDPEGWRALSARCTYEGCDLSFNELGIDVPVLLCACCRTRFSLAGQAIGGGPAEDPLPWIDIFYRDGHLYANTAVKRPPNWRFMTPEIREAEETLRQQIKPEGVSDEVKIPPILSGNPERDPGQMFVEDDPLLLDQLKMAK